MSQFIDELIKEHKVLLAMLDGFKKGQGVVGKEWKEKLFAAKKLFERHLQKEDEQLYPTMIEAAAQDIELHGSVMQFSDEMKRISELVNQFLDKYKAVSSGSDFIRDFAEVEINLKKRIDREETILYPEYEKLL